MKDCCLTIYIYIYIVGVTQSDGALEYTDCTSAAGIRPHPTSVLDMALNNMMVRFW